MKLFIIFIATLLTLNASSFVWKISKNGSSLYLGGTIHVLKQSDYPLPLEFDAAYNDSDILVLETDLAQTQTPEFAQQIMQNLVQSEGRTLRDDLSKKVYIQLKKRIASMGLDMNSIDRFKVSMVVLNLTVMELQKMGVSAQGVDAYYSAKAYEDVKKMLYLESVEDQMNLIASMGEGHEDELILQTLNDLDTLEHDMNKMTQLWRAGRAEELYEFASRDFMLEFPELYEEILLERNKNWLPQILDMFETKKIEYILVGSMHLVGPDGLLDLLRARGYKIEQL